MSNSNPSGKTHHKCIGIGDFTPQAGEKAWRGCRNSQSIRREPFFGGGGKGKGSEVDLDTTVVVHYSLATAGSSMGVSAFDSSVGATAWSLVA